MRSSYITIGAMMDAQELETIKKLTGIFMPYAADKLAQIRAAKKRFAHYSSAENIFKIMRSLRGVAADGGPRANHDRGSQPTLCWREMDSNHRYPRERSLLSSVGTRSPEPPRGGDGMSAPTGKGQCVQQR
jgi:hypothetical protein